MINILSDLRDSGELEVAESGVGDRGMQLCNPATVVGLELRKHNNA